MDRTCVSSVFDPWKAVYEELECPEGVDLFTRFACGVQKSRTASVPTASVQLNPLLAEERRQADVSRCRSGKSTCSVIVDNLTLI
jgi:hypothetical protein